MWRLRTGSGWRDVPERYGSWSTLYDRFNAWSKAGVFQALMDALIVEAASRGQVGLELVSVDSTIDRAHHESAGLAIAGETLLSRRPPTTPRSPASVPVPPRYRALLRRPDQPSHEVVTDGQGDHHPCSSRPKNSQHSLTQILQNASAEAKCLAGSASSAGCGA